MSLLRQPIAVSDLSPDPPGLYSYQSSPSAKFSVKLDGPILPLLSAALELNPNIKIIATPWSRTDFFFEYLRSPSYVLILTTKI
mgnify:CR=1 FL=1